MGGVIYRTKEECERGLPSDYYCRRLPSFSTKTGYIRAKLPYWAIEARRKRR